jgi:5-methylcytosine-specific restriction endonuclease McrA
MKEIIAYSALLFILISFITRYFAINSSIKKNSKLFIELQNLNSCYAALFYQIDAEYNLHMNCNSLQKYRNNNNGEAIMHYICVCVRENETIWTARYDKINNNKNNLKKYLDEYETIKHRYSGKSYQTVKRKTILFSQKQYIKFEEKYCKDKLLKPITSLSIKVKLSYTSPAGRKHYATKWIIEKTYVDEIFIRIKNKKAMEQSIAYQRTMMTTGKRYDVLRRDKFTCQICGRTQNDGAKLEVDHIIPVSKGGKTADHNLQTLCYE